MDRKTLEYRLVPLNLKTAKLVITNSNVPHKLSSSQYNQRVSECNEAVKILSTLKRGTSLRDFTLADYEKVRTAIPESIRKRRHSMLYPKTSAF